MPSIRFLHTSDLHLGKRFGRFAEETRMALLQARQEILARLAKLAQAHDATHVLIAGDMFDTETPSERVQRQAGREARAREGRGVRPHAGQRLAEGLDGTCVLARAL